MPFPRFGTLTDTATAAVLLLVLASSGRVAWLGVAYGIVIAATMLIKLAALVRLRTRKPGASFRVPLTLAIGKRQWPLGLWLIGLLVAIAAVALFGYGEVSAYGGVLLIAGVTVALTTRLPKHDRLALLTATTCGPPREGRSCRRSRAPFGGR